MTPRALLALAATAALVTGAFVVMVPRAPGAFVAVLTAGAFGAGILYGEPTPRAVAHPWRLRRTWYALALRLRTRWLARALTRVGWNRLVRRPIGSPADLPGSQRDATAALISHAASLGLHLAATTALLVTVHPWWGAACLVLGAVLHGWPCLLQIEVLVRLDRLQARLAARGRGGRAG